MDGDESEGDVGQTGGFSECKVEIWAGDANSPQFNRPECQRPTTTNTRPQSRETTSSPPLRLPSPSLAQGISAVKEFMRYEMVIWKRVCVGVTTPRHEICFIFKGLAFRCIDCRLKEGRRQYDMTVEPSVSKSKSEDEVGAHLYHNPRPLSAFDARYRISSHLSLDFQGPPVAAASSSPN